MTSVASRVTRSAKRQETKVHEGWVEHYSFTSRVITDITHGSSCIKSRLTSDSVLLNSLKLM